MYDSVCEWWLDINDGSGIATRELGIDSSGAVITAGPLASYYGLWTDSPVTFDALEWEQVEASKFEAAWDLFTSQFHAQIPGAA